MAQHSSVEILQAVGKLLKESLDEHSRNSTGGFVTEIPELTVKPRRRDVDRLRKQSWGQKALKRFEENVCCVLDTLLHQVAALRLAW